MQANIFDGAGVCCQDDVCVRRGWNKGSWKKLVSCGVLGRSLVRCRSLVSSRCKLTCAKKKYEKKVLPHTGSCHDSRCKKQKNGICHVPLLAGPRLLVSQLKTAWHATSDCGLAHDGTFEREQLSRVIDYYQETCLMEK